MVLDTTTNDIIYVARSDDYPTFFDSLGFKAADSLTSIMTLACDLANACKVYCAIACNAHSCGILQALNYVLRQQPLAPVENDVCPGMASK